MYKNFSYDDLINGKVKFVKTNNKVFDELISNLLNNRYKFDGDYILIDESINIRYDIIHSNFQNYGLFFEKDKIGKVDDDNIVSAIDIGVKFEIRYKNFNKLYLSFDKHGNIDFIKFLKFLPNLKKQESILIRNYLYCCSFEIVPSSKVKFIKLNGKNISLKKIINLFKFKINLSKSNKKIGCFLNTLKKFNFESYQNCLNIDFCQFN